MATKTPEKTPSKQPLSTVESVTKILTSFSDSSNCPNSFKPYIKAAIPFIATFISFISSLLPFISQVYSAWMVIYVALKPYRIDLLFPSFLGLVMCFFGGSYCTTIAAYEAFMMCGSENVIKCVKMLVDDLQKVKEANEKDDKVRFLQLL